MSKRKIAFDETEVVMAVMLKQEFGKEKAKILNVTYDQFLKISIIPIEERKFFRIVPSEKIVIKLKKYAQEFEFTKMQNKEFYEEYKISFIDFAKKNRIDLIEE